MTLRVHQMKEKHPKEREKGATMRLLLPIRAENTRVRPPAQLAVNPLKEGSSRINQILVQMRGGKEDPLTGGAVAVLMKVQRGWKSERGHQDVQERLSTTEETKAENVRENKCKKNLRENNTTLHRHLLHQSRGGTGDHGVKRGRNPLRQEDTTLLHHLLHVSSSETEDNGVKRDRNPLSGKGLALHLALRLLSSRKTRTKGTMAERTKVKEGMTHPHPRLLHVKTEREEDTVEREKLP